MKRTLLDTNIILDIALKRDPFFDIIVTRNKSDFHNSILEILSPAELIERLK